MRAYRNSQSRLAAAALALAILAAPWTASADAPKTGDADSHFRRGVELYKDNDYATALVEFQRAYDIDPKFQVLYNIAGSQVQLQDYAGALKTFQRYLTEGGKKVTPRRKFEVEREIEKLKKRVARLTVTTSEIGAAVSIDDMAAATTPMAEPIVVSAGRRKVTATLAGRPPVTQMVDLAGGDTQTILLQIPPKPVVEVVAPPARPLGTAAIVAWSVTGAIVTATVVTGSLALAASGDLKDSLAQFPGDSKAIASARSRTTTFSLATDVLVGTSIAAAGVSLFLTLWKRGAPAATPPATGVTRFVVSPAGAGIAGAF